MELPDLLLRKEEIPILHDICFRVPVHPLLYLPERCAWPRPPFTLDKNLAYSVFPQAVQEWYDELKNHTAQLPDGEDKRWYERVFLAAEPTLENRRGRYRITSVPSWTTDVVTDDNGFAFGMGISRDFGGSLCPPKEETLCRPYVCFSPEKLLAYALPGDEPDVEGGQIVAVNGLAYTTHNIDYFPGALLLRNWGMLYVNAALQSLEPELQQWEAERRRATWGVELNAAEKT